MIPLNVRQAELAVHLKIKSSGPYLQKSVHTITCPACGQETPAVAWDGVIRGYCAVKNAYIKPLKVED